MDPATLLGIAIAFVAMLVMMVMEGSSPMSIVIPAPLILVFGGTLGAAMAGTTLRDFLGIGKLIKRALMSRPTVSTELVEAVVKLAERARREGLLALEDAIREVDDEFLRRGLELAIDGTDPDELATILELEIAAKRRADHAGAKIFTDMGGYAPTIGIIGTVISLVHVLGHMENVGEIGHMIAAAFVATLWGVLSANVMWLPIAAKLKRLSDLEAEKMELALDGILSIQAGANPRLIARKLSSMLPPGQTVEPARKAA